MTRPPFGVVVIKTAGERGRSCFAFWGGSGRGRPQSLHRKNHDGIRAGDSGNAPTRPCGAITGSCALSINHLPERKTKWDGKRNF